MTVKNIMEAIEDARTARNKIQTHRLESILETNIGPHIEAYYEDRISIVELIRKIQAETYKTVGV